MAPHHAEHPGRESFTRRPVVVERIGVEHQIGQEFMHFLHIAGQGRPCRAPGRRIRVVHVDPVCADYILYLVAKLRRIPAYDRVHSDGAVDHRLHRRIRDAPRTHAVPAVCDALGYVEQLTRAHARQNRRIDS